VRAYSAYDPHFDCEECLLAQKSGKRSTVKIDHLVVEVMDSEGFIKGLETFLQGHAGQTWSYKFVEEE